jgi:hypothetical protein
MHGLIDLSPAEMKPLEPIRAELRGDRPATAQGVSAINRLGELRPLLTPVGQLVQWAIGSESNRRPLRLRRTRAALPDRLFCCGKWHAVV